jgi:pimeloyl-ACP methyl ester carboxylesterase
MNTNLFWGFLLLLQTYSMSAQTEANMERIAVQVGDVAVVGYGSRLSAALPLLVMMHGSPGDWTAMSKYLQDSALQQKYRMIAFSRPGYGESDSTKAYPSLSFQAEVVHAFVDSFARGQSVTVMGHSVGGAVATRYALDYAVEVKQIILLAPTVSEKHEQPRFYNHLAKRRWAQRFIAQPMKISNVEMFALPGDLAFMEPQLKSVSTKTWLFHGKMDMIAPYGNARLLAATIPPDLLTFRSYFWQNHFLPWTKFQDIKALLLSEQIQ